jgi:glutamyl-Q tRNA(Asp) synthetase
VRPGTAYTGRFAPSPTGPLHLGSLLAALGSYLDAHAHAGRWLVRMEDLDAARELPGCATQILATLEAFGLNWDGSIEYQSARAEHYSAALAQLRAAGLTFECSCSRRELADEPGYPGSCRQGPRHAGPTATRFRVPSVSVGWQDRLQGRCDYPLGPLGDVIIRRRDGGFAYQLAVVVDDAAQAVTDVVRGADLIESTPWQIALQGALGLPSVRYAHLPLLTEASGAKLAKSRRSVALEPIRASAQLCQVLGLLGQAPPAGLELEPVHTVLAWAIQHWRPERLAGLTAITAPDP